MIDTLLKLVAECEAQAKERLQQNRTEYLEHERARLLELADAMDTARELAKYGVKL